MRTKHLSSLLVALLSSAALSTPLIAQEAPAAEVEAAPAAEAAAPSKFVAERGVIIAQTADGQERWRHRVNTNENIALHGPVAVGSSLFYCARSYVWEADAVSGVVARRHTLWGQCEGLVASGPGVTASSKGEDGSRWSWEAQVALTPGQPVAPRRPEQVFGPLMLRAQAMRVLEDAVPGLKGVDADAARVAAMATPEARAKLEAEALPELARRIAQDPTNPWYHAARASALQALGRAGEASEARGALLGLDPAYHDDLVAVSVEIDRDDPVVAGQLFELGLKHALEHGYEPELANSLIGVIGSFGALGKLGLDVETPEGLRRLDRLGERLHAYAPRAEMIAGFYSGMATAQAKAGDAARAEVWRARAGDERAQAFFGVPSTDARMAGGLLTILIAMLFVFPLALLIKGARTLGATFPEGVSAAVRYNPLSRWSRGELIGLILLLPMAHLLALRIAAGVATIGMLASAPVSMASGTLGAPSALKFVTEAAGGPLIAGVHQHRAGARAEAEASYLRDGSPEAKNNLGVLKAEQGDVAAARALWQEVAAAVPEAAHNLGQPADGARVARAKGLGVTRPLLALPTDAQWDSFWDSKVAAAGSDVGNPITSIFAVANLSDGIEPDGASAPPAASLLGGLGWLVVALGVLALATAWGAPVPVHKRWHKGGWAVGHLVPGMARQWGAFGPVVTAFVLTALFARMNMSAGGTPSILDNIAMPSFARYYGAGETFVPAYMQQLVALGQWWWALWLGGVVASVGLEVAMRDPVRDAG